MVYRVNPADHTYSVKPNYLTLEGESSSKLNNTSTNRSTGYTTETCAVDVNELARSEERRVRYVERFSTDLERCSFSDRETLRQRNVGTRQPWAVDDRSSHAAGLIRTVAEKYLSGKRRQSITARPDTACG